MYLEVYQIADTRIIVHIYDDLIELFALFDEGQITLEFYRSGEDLSFTFSSSGTIIDVPNYGTDVGDGVNDGPDGFKRSASILKNNLVNI